MDRFLLLAMTLLLTHISHCQSLLKAGDPTIRYELIKPTVTLYKIATTDSTGKVLTEFTCRNTVSVNPDKGWVIVTQQFHLPDGRTLLDSTIADLKTLAPVRMRMVTTPHFMKMDLRFAAREVYAVADKGGHLIDTLHRMEEGYFDSNLLEYLIGLLPYKKGFNARLNVYTFERNGMDPWQVEYVGEDMLGLAGGGTVQCYVARTGNAGVAPDAMAWIEKATGKVVKRVIPMGKMYYVITKV
ncbi:hypothetical protein [Paraflavitalea sp. CAU 1676]|uniref:DUF3108 domain-containing protein n=1 Tax=Paraflavitalea sp. CAU 1676 TaxID=3032598 RepID=UPI0023DB681E|nr:hypothetical protein [Paraflavitalea sp. CAU 1676]MDF2190067.1 hypothetical protein [Paraflavitalea sp. CAU 1676]